MKSKKEGRQAFLFYVDDWLSSTRIAAMTASEERAYLRLLLHAAKQPDGGLPKDDGFLAEISLLGRKWKGESGRRVRACFKEREGRLFNDRLCRELEHQRKYHERRRAAAKRAAERKAYEATNGGTNGGTNERQNEAQVATHGGTNERQNGLQKRESSSSSSSSSTECSGISEACVCASNGTHAHSAKKPSAEFDLDRQRAELENRRKHSVDADAELAAKLEARS